MFRTLPWKKGNAAFVLILERVEPLQSQHSVTGHVIFIAACCLGNSYSPIGRGTTACVHCCKHNTPTLSLQEKYLAKRKNLHLAFVDLEKAFDRVLRRVVWWAMRKLGVDEWLVKAVQSMYTDARS